MSLSRSTPQAASLIVSVLLIEIAQAFGKSIGEASQMMTFSSILGTLTALALTLLTVRYSPTHLHNVGLAICLLSSLGCIFAPAYPVLFVLYGVCGVGPSLVTPMTTTITGELTSGEERSRSLGIIIATQAIFYLFGILIVGWVSEWRLAFAYFAAPLLALSLLASITVIPMIESGGEKESLSAGLRRICMNRSAISCLFAAAITGVWTVVVSFVASYYRDVHGIPLSTVTVLIAGMALTFASGAFAGGRFMPRLGAKKATTISQILLGASFIMISSNTFVSVASGFFLSLVSGVNVTALNGLTLSQVPEYRGSMMSLFTASASLGGSLNLALMGILLTSYGWAYASTVVGILGIISGVLVHLFVTENPQQNH